MKSYLIPSVGLLFGYRRCLKKKKLHKGCLTCSLSFPPIPHYFLPFLLSFPLSFTHSPLALLSLTLSFPTNTCTHLWPSERENRTWEWEQCCLEVEERKKEKVGFWKLYPVGINSSDQRSFMVRSSWNFAGRFTTRESPLWTVKIGFGVFCSHFLPP